MCSAPHLLQFLPPIAPPKPNALSKPSLALHDTTSGARRRGALDITCAAKTTPDDYHATLKALNSRARKPRKSLGQDPHMAALVTERFSHTDRLKVLQEDFVKCHIRSHMSSLLESVRYSDGKLRYAKVVANIPFNISTDVVKQLLPMGDIFSEVALLLQEETALRLVEAPLRTSDYRPINIFVNFYAEPEYKLNVPRSNFFPQPNVDAAVVTFKLKKTADYPAVSSTKSFFSMVNSAFNGKRKMLRKSLQHISTPLEIEEALQNVGRLPTSRPEELTMDDFVKLHNMISRV